MTLLQQLIYQTATDAEFRTRLQKRTIGESLTKEKQEALRAVHHLLKLSPQDLVRYLADSEGISGWNPRENACQLQR